MSTAASEPRNLYAGIERLVEFALANGMIAPHDKEYAINSLLDLFNLSEPAETEEPSEASELPDGPMPILEPLLDAAFELGLIPENTTTYRDLFDARIMGLLMPRPSETNAIFRQLAESKGISEATDWFYKLSVDSNYIRMDRIRKNGYWRHATEYGELEITINLSKPEKDPKEIALLKTLPQSNYPKCLLCKENVGYAGRVNHPARQNLRAIPLELQGAPWFLQYSPYVYYNEHSIVFSGEHVPMKISHATFPRLLDFVESFPHYFIGSNADLPIVGGSILNHDHFQAGRHVFPMETAVVDRWRQHATEGAVTVGVVRWPMSVLRLRSADREALLRVSNSILDAWRGYSDPAAEVAAFTGETPHNTITPIARMTDKGEYELDLVLRNNRTSEEHPDGIFHPHKELHHIKKENIGLIEVMGLAVLPGRLQEELAEIAQILTGAAPYDAAELAKADHPLAKHAPWIAELVAEHGIALGEWEALNLLRSAVGDKFRAVLADAGVYKDNEAGRAAIGRFLAAVGFGG
nr:UDP-glucose--hexose-1-phosphate uridylyltransferase [Cohnella sp. AR92]